jgi:teichoic acid transport system permease protein
MSQAELAAEHGLHRVGARPRFFKYLADTWSRRQFALTLARYRIRSSVEANRLGLLWIVLRPTLNALIYGAIFGTLQQGRRPADYAAYVVVGVFFFQFFSGSMQSGAKSITGNRALVQSLAFPRLTLPLATVLQELLSFLVTLVVLLPIVMVFGHMPDWDWFLLIPLVILFTLFNTGVALICARLTVHVQDLTQILPFVTRILFYTSGVLFNVDAILKDHPAIIAAFDFYPVYQVLQLARHILTDTAAYNPSYWGFLAATAIFTFVVGSMFFWAAEERYGRD